MLQSVAGCCSVSQGVAVCCSVLQCVGRVRASPPRSLFRLCCSVLQRVAVRRNVLCCSVLQCIRSVLQGVAECCSVSQGVAVCCSVAVRWASLRVSSDFSLADCRVLQCFAVFCSVLQCFVVFCSVL